MKRLPFPERFWVRVAKGDGCWVWTGFVNQDGYGRLQFGGRLVMAHRVCWELTRGQAPREDLRVLHRCDNPPCVRPDHLFLGTQADNVADMMAKGRQVVTAGEANGRARIDAASATVARALYDGGFHPQLIAEWLPLTSRDVHDIGRRRKWRAPGEAEIRTGRLVGSKVSSSRLLADSVMEIRRQFRIGVADRAIARRFAVTAQSIRAIRLGQSWKHLREEDTCAG